MKTLPIDSDLICTVIESLLGGCAEPIGETNTDDIKLEIQKTEEEVIYWLMDDIYRCYEKKNVYWYSGKRAGKRAEIFLQDLLETTQNYLKEGEKHETD